MIVSLQQRLHKYLLKCSLKNHCLVPNMLEGNRKSPGSKLKVGHCEGRERSGSAESPEALIGANSWSSRAANSPGSLHVRLVTLARAREEESIQKPGTEQVGRQVPGNLKEPRLLKGPALLCLECPGESRR